MITQNTDQVVVTLPARTFTIPKSSKVVAAIGCALAIGLGAFYAGPYITIWQIRSAAIAKDSEALSSHVDFPALRTNLKATFSAAMLAKASDAKDGGGFEMLGAAMAGMFVDRMVDSMVTPEAVAALMTRGERVRVSNTDVAEGERAPTAEIATTMGYDGFSSFAITRDDTSFVLTRDGFSWRLTGIRIPLDKLR